MNAKQVATTGESRHGRFMIDATGTVVAGRAVRCGCDCGALNSSCLSSEQQQQHTKLAAGWRLGHSRCVRPTFHLEAATATAGCGHQSSTEAKDTDVFYTRFTHVFLQPFWGSTFCYLRERRAGRLAEGRRLEQVQTIRVVRVQGRAQPFPRPLRRSFIGMATALFFLRTT